jgi:hypothetical protein
MNFQIIEQDITDPFYRYTSDEVSADTWSQDQVKLKTLAEREKLYFFTFTLTFPSDNGTKMFAISDEYIPEPSLEYELLYDPTA